MLTESDQRFERNFRLMGLLPISFFIAQAFHYWRIDELAHMLWMCNLGNFILGVGMLLYRPILIRVAVLWMIPGLVVWFIYVVLTWGVFLTSTLAHVGGLVVGVFALSKVGMDRLSWLYAFVWYLIVQLISRLITAPEFNVNVSHAIQPGWESTFGVYWKFWAVLTIAVAIALWLLGFMLNKIWPAPVSAPASVPVNA